jgi:hypothetical protein
MSLSDFVLQPPKENGFAIFMNGRVYARQRLESVVVKHGYNIRHDRPGYRTFATAGYAGVGAGQSSGVIVLFLPPENSAAIVFLAGWKQSIRWIFRYCTTFRQT